MPIQNAEDREIVKIKYVENDKQITNEIIPMKTTHNSTASAMFFVFGLRGN